MMKHAGKCQPIQYTMGVFMEREKRKSYFKKVDIYPVTCERLSGGRSYLEVIDGLIKGGARIVQLRGKDICERDFFRLAEIFRERTAKAGMLLIGASSHNLQEALRAWDDGADYLNISPVFPTGTKEGVEHFLGPGAIAQIAPRLRIPFTVMGGI